jgi:hypothetical protein
MQHMPLCQIVKLSEDLREGPRFTFTADSRSVLRLDFSSRALRICGYNNAGIPALHTRRLVDHSMITQDLGPPDESATVLGIMQL